MTWQLHKVDEVELLFPVDKVRGKARPRFSGKTGRTYTPAPTTKLEKFIAECFERDHGNAYAKFNGVVHMTLFVTRELAKSNPKFWEGRQDVGKPDWDNIAKLVCDALNGVAYNDDSQVTAATVVKMPRAPHGEGSSYRIVLEYFKEEYVGNPTH